MSETGEQVDVHIVDSHPSQQRHLSRDCLRRMLPPGRCHLSRNKGLDAETHPIDAKLLPCMNSLFGDCAGARFDRGLTPIPGGKAAEQSVKTVDLDQAWRASAEIERVRFRGEVGCPDLGLQRLEGGAHPVGGEHPR